MNSVASAELADGGLGVGRALAEAREAQGLALTDISQQLKFMTRQLEALEAERFDQLPGPTIARGMVRTYARFLKLDPEPLLARMTGHVETRDATPQLAARFNQPVPFADSGRRSTVVYLILSALVLAGGGGVLYEWRHERAVPEFVAAADIAPRPEPTASVSVPPAVEPAKQTKAVEPSKATPAKPVETAKPALPVQVAERSSEPKSIGGNRMVFRFDESAWLEVTNGGGKLLISSLQAAGSERVVNCSLPCSLVVGNASHVRISHNDRVVDVQSHAKSDVARFTLK